MTEPTTPPADKLGADAALIALLRDESSPLLPRETRKAADRLETLTAGIEQAIFDEEQALDRAEKAEATLAKVESYALTPCLEERDEDGDLLLSYDYIEAVNGARADVLRILHGNGGDTDE